jgi:Mother cell inhibitor of FtsZ
MVPNLKIYRLEKGIVLVGKAWEIRAKLKEYSQSFVTVNDWLQDEKALQYPVISPKKH